MWNNPPTHHRRLRTEDRGLSVQTLCLLSFRGGLQANEGPAVHLGIGLSSPVQLNSCHPERSARTVFPDTRVLPGLHCARFSRDGVSVGRARSRRTCGSNALSFYTLCQGTTSVVPIRASIFVIPSEGFSPSRGTCFSSSWQDCCRPAHNTSPQPDTNLAQGVPGSPTIVAFAVVGVVKLRCL